MLDGDRFWEDQEVAKRLDLKKYIVPDRHIVWWRDISGREKNMNKGTYDMSGTFREMGAFKHHKSLSYSGEPTEESVGARSWQAFCAGTWGSELYLLGSGWSLQSFKEENYVTWIAISITDLPSWIFKVEKTTGCIWPHLSCHPNLMGM